MTDRPDFESIEYRLRHLVELLGVTTDAAFEAPAEFANVASLLWIARNMASQMLADMEAATDQVARIRVKGGKRL